MAKVESMFAETALGTEVRIEEEEILCELLTW